MTDSDDKVFQILWQTLDGGHYNIDDLKKTMNGDTPLVEVLDSLDMTDFVLRLEHHYKIAIPQSDFPTLGTVAAIDSYVRRKSPTFAHA